LQASFDQKKEFTFIQKYIVETTTLARHKDKTANF